MRAPLSAMARLATILALVIVFVGLPKAQAACTGVVAGGGLRFAAAGAEVAVAITFLGHASFLIESPGGVRIVTTMTQYGRR